MGGKNRNGGFMREHRWFGLLGLLALICLPLFILRDTIHDILT